MWRRIRKPLQLKLVMLPLLLAIQFIILPMLVIGCGFPPVPGSRSYQPVSEWEQREFQKANRQVYPNDVRTNLEKFQDTTVAWPGVIIKSEFHEVDTGIDMVLQLDHHFYDWIEDFGLQREKIFLSPRGEGSFQTTWYLKKGGDTTEVKRYAESGNLAIVYGVPLEIVDNGTVILKASYVRGIEKKWYRTDMLDYGRE